MALAELIGVGTGPIRWNRVFALLGAMYLSGVAVNLLGCTFSREWAVSPRFVFYFVLFDIANVAVMAAAFRLLRNPWVAVPAGALGYAVLAIPVRYVVAGNTERLLSSSLNSFIYFGFLAAGLVLAAGKIRRPWLALVVGVAAGGGIADLVNGLVRAWGDFENYRLGAQFFGVAMTVLGAPVFATVLAAAQETPGASRRLSLAFYMQSVIWGVLLGNIAIQLAAASLIESRYNRDWVGAWILGMAALLYGAVAFLRLIYKMWRAIQDGGARTTPGAAVWKLFIPVYNLYALFQALPGFATDYNNYLAQKAIVAPKLSRGLLTAVAVLLLVDGAASRAMMAVDSMRVTLAFGWIGVIYALTLLHAASRICQAVNALPEPERG